MEHHLLHINQNRKPQSLDACAEWYSNLCFMDAIETTVDQFYDTGFRNGKGDWETVLSKG